MDSVQYARRCYLSCSRAASLLLALALALASSTHFLACFLFALDLSPIGFVGVAAIVVRAVGVGIVHAVVRVGAVSAVCDEAIGVFDDGVIGVVGGVEAMSLEELSVLELSVLEQYVGFSCQYCGSNFERLSGL
jgi:hypothetical protein